MSANNQTLIKKGYDVYYVFENINAESWGEENIIDKDKHQFKVFYTHKQAQEYAYFLEKQEPTEYGIVEEVLYKDGAKVIIK